MTNSVNPLEENTQPLRRFVVESNAIEGIWDTQAGDVNAHLGFLAREPSIPALSVFVRNVASAELRDEPGMNVRVGSHVPPPGGPGVVYALSALIDEADTLSPFELYCRYENLHPFMDGNGRSGRALWLWRHNQLGTYRMALQRGFLASFHYEALEAHDGRRKP